MRYIISGYFSDWKADIVHNYIGEFELSPLFEDVSRSVSLLVVN